MVPFRYESQGLLMPTEHKLYVNNELFCKGDLIKVLFPMTGGVKDDLKIRIFFPEKGSENVELVRPMLATGFSPRWFMMLDTSRDLAVGSYIAQVFSSASSPGTEPVDVLGEHHFQVLS